MPYAYKRKQKQAKRDWYREEYAADPEFAEKERQRKAEQAKTDAGREAARLRQARRQARLRGEAEPVVPPPPPLPSTIAGLWELCPLTPLRSKAGYRRAAEVCGRLAKGRLTAVQRGYYRELLALVEAWEPPARKAAKKRPQ